MHTVRIWEKQTSNKFDVSERKTNEQNEMNVWASEREQTENISDGFRLSVDIWWPIKNVLTVLERDISAERAKWTEKRLC